MITIRFVRWYCPFSQQLDLHWTDFIRWNNPNRGKGRVFLNPMHICFILLCRPVMCDVCKTHTSQSCLSCLQYKPLTYVRFTWLCSPLIIKTGLIEITRHEVNCGKVIITTRGNPWWCVVRTIIIFLGKPRGCVVKARIITLGKPWGCLVKTRIITRVKSSECMVKW